MGLGFGFVVPKFFDLYNAWCPWDTSALNYPTGYKFSTEEECKKHCDECNVMWYDEKGNVIYKRSQWKDWEAMNSLAKILDYDDVDGVPYIDTALKKIIIPNLFNRLAFRHLNIKNIHDDEYSKWYKKLSEECK